MCDGKARQQQRASRGAARDGEEGTTVHGLSPLGFFVGNVYAAFGSSRLRSRGMLACAAAEDQAPQHRGRARVDLVIDAHGFASGIQARDHPPILVEHLRIAVDLEAAEGEAVGGNDRIGLEWALVDRA
ncbi:hypothetical protein D9M68_920860 [compost metagenome]